MKQCLLRSTPFDNHTVKLDITGSRVSIYNSLVGIVNTIEYTILPLLYGYSTMIKKIKLWKNQPDDHFIMFRMEVMKVVQIDKPMLRHMNEFQDKIVNEWNRCSNDCSLLIIPPISLNNEIKPNGYGMAIIDFYVYLDC